MLNHVFDLHFSMISLKPGSVAMLIQ